MDINDTAVIIQARMSSRRFPGKMLADVGGMTLVEYMFARCRQAGLPKTLVATSTGESDDPLAEVCKDKDIPVFRGDLDDVLDRFIQAAGSVNAKFVVRVCGDTPFVDPGFIREFAEKLVSRKLDYVSFRDKDLMGAFYSEAVSVEALKRCAEEAEGREDREHVTRYILNHRDDFRISLADVSPDTVWQRNVRLTADYPEDIDRINSVIEHLPDHLEYPYYDVIETVNKDKSKEVVN